VDTGSRQENTSELDEQLQWQQVAMPQKKAGARPAFLNLGNSDDAAISTA
jgi:hypothetical protein